MDNAGALVSSLNIDLKYWYFSFCTRWTIKELTAYEEISWRHWAINKERF
jgi:hypothetical protein